MNRVKLYRIGDLWNRIELQSIIFVFVLATVLLLVVYPLFLVIFNSFQLAPPGRPRIFGLDGWRAALSEPGMISSIYNTLTLLLVRQAAAFPIAILTTWILARTDVPGKSFLEFLFWLSFFLPPLSVTLGWILHLVPLLILAAAALARAGRRRILEAASLAAVVFVVPILATLRDSAPVFAALHPVGAIFAFWLAIVVARGATSLREDEAGALGVPATS